MLNTAVQAARKAGTIITRASFDLDKLTIATKRQADFVSEVDDAAEDAIISVLKKAYPDHGFLAEESGYKDREAEYMWVIDPLDGTTNFLHGVPQYCVSIGLMHKGKAHPGGRLGPHAQRALHGEQGRRRLPQRPPHPRLQGRQARGRPHQHGLSVQGDRPRRRLPRDAEERDEDHFGREARGRGGADLAYVACGRYDGFWEKGLSPWDMCAGALLIREAGGLVGDYQGNDGFLDKGEVIAANSKIFAALLKTLHSKA
jgi:myo-inositol-1(or 4)-monophosphatase